MAAFLAWQCLIYQRLAIWLDVVGFCHSDILFVNT